MTTNQFWAVEITKNLRAKVRKASSFELERPTRDNWKEGIEIYSDYATAKARENFFNDNDETITRNVKTGRNA